MSWAISTGEGGYIGVFWFTPELPDWTDGQRTALFSTREAARERLKKVKRPKREGGYPRARVVRVHVEIVEMQKKSPHPHPRNHQRGTNRK